VPIEGEVIEDASKDAFKLVGMDDQIDVSNPAAQKFLKENTVKFSDAVTEETNKLLGTQLAEGVELGESVPQLRSRVEGVFDGMTRMRANRIARSEVIRATNWATEQAYIESKVVEAKIWLTAMDERVCEWCGPMDGEEVGLGRTFLQQGSDFIGEDGGVLPIEYEPINRPPLHPNCRCTIIPRVKS